MSKELELDQWRRASLHDESEGLEEGVDVQATLRSVRRYKSRRLAYGALRCVCDGAMLTQARRYKLGLSRSPLCLRCGQAPETALHTFYQCPANSAIGDPVMQDTAGLCDLAVSATNRSLYVRGLVPSSLMAVDPPPPRADTVWTLKVS